MISGSTWTSRLLLTIFGTSLMLSTVASHCTPLQQNEKQAAATYSGNTTNLLPLPQFKACASTKRPVLPPKWEATALMEDFFLDTLWYGKFVYDEDAKAFRFSVADDYGVDYDFLVTSDRRLYLLEGGDIPKSCKLETTASPYTVPQREWLQPSASCVGQAPILNRDQQWWKNPSGPVGANWFWYDVVTGLPFRSMYYTEPKRTVPAPVYEYFTFDYFPTFKPVASTNLAQIVKMCRGGSQEPAATQEFSELSLQPLIKKKSTYPKINDHPVQKWIPGVTKCSSPGSLPPAWPKQTQLTAFMTAVNATPNPFPTRVFYDWTRLPQAQNSTLYTYPEDPKNYAQTALLTGATGYIAFVQKDGTVTDCKQVLPGTQVPNWKEVDRCECRGEIAPRTVLNPSNVPTKILWCKTDLAAQQVFWTWYSTTGTPVVFMQSNSSPTAGTGLNLADYYGWSPGSIAPSGTYDLPDACKKAPKVPNAYPKACNDCHMPLNLPKGKAAQ